MSIDNYNYTVSERFMNYARIDTEADPNSTTFPSTMKQKDLGKVLVKELLEIGAVSMCAQKQTVGTFSLPLVAGIVA